MPKHERSTDELCRKLFTFLNDEELMSLDEANRILREAGHDPDQVGKQVKAVADQAIASSPHNWRNRAKQDRQRVQNTLDRFRSENKNLDRLGFIDAINNLVVENSLSVSYRNLQEMTDEDLESLLQDLLYLVSEKEE